MITRIPVREETSTWQQQLALAITDPEILFSRLDLDRSDLAAAHLADRNFKLKVTASYLGRMERGNPGDPLLLQILPDSHELEPQPSGYSNDPVADLEATRATGLIHKYHGRVLLIAAGSCAINCRYCFRRHFPYADSTAARQNWAPALEYLAANDSVNEVILSGGDPLVLSDEKLLHLLDELEAIPHLSRLRIHSRLPIVLPARLTQGLLARLQRSRLDAVLVVHANHPQEIDDEVSQTLQHARSYGLTLLNQAVLLRGINDSAEILANLSEKIFTAGALPYYLNLLDKVQGAAHFEVPKEEALAIYRDLSEMLPGYLLPRLVQDEAGAKSKTQH
ncbi:MAG: EF-P beta-lysylation protein EpmB [Thiotrichales bacterium]